MQVPFLDGDTQTNIGNQIMPDLSVKKILLKYHLCQLAPLLDAKLICKLIHLTMPQLFQIGVYQMSIGNQTMLDQLEKRISFNLNPSLFHHAILLNARLELLLNHSTARSQMDTRLTILSQILVSIKK